MDQAQIGKFIASCRKEKKLTQAALAEKLGISDRAVSKWETGRSMPDASIIPTLCEEIGITVNDLFSGRRITMNMEMYKAEAEKNLLLMKKNQEENNRELLKQEIVISVISTASFLVLLPTALLPEHSTAVRALMIVTAVLVFGYGMYSAMRIERNAGYYECAECGHRYIPTFSAVLWAPHMGRTRKMRCPECGERSWQKKVLTLEYKLPEDKGKE